MSTSAPLRLQHAHGVRFRVEHPVVQAEKLPLLENEEQVLQRLGKEEGLTRVGLDSPWGPHVAEGRVAVVTLRPPVVVRDGVRGPAAVLRVAGVVPHVVPGLDSFRPEDHLALVDRHVLSLAESPGLGAEADGRLRVHLVARVRELGRQGGPLLRRFTGRQLVHPVDEHPGHEAGQVLHRVALRGAEVGEAPGVLSHELLGHLPDGQLPPPEVLRVHLAALYPHLQEVLVVGVLRGAHRVERAREAPALRVDGVRHEAVAPRGREDQVHGAVGELREARVPRLLREVAELQLVRPRLRQVDAVDPAVPVLVPVLRVDVALRQPAQGVDSDPALGEVVRADVVRAECREEPHAQVGAPLQEEAAPREAVRGVQAADDTDRRLEEGHVLLGRVEPELARDPVGGALDLLDEGPVLEAHQPECAEGIYDGGPHVQPVLPPAPAHGARRVAPPGGVPVAAPGVAHHPQDLPAHVRGELLVRGMP
mmetsp:Transcript_41709/g.117902  ORF Transcript_41709/g.117902 Transcript_41709/m.117902 type:complete len:480 (-) Transcript_41709:102-1541(-)